MNPVLASALRSGSLSSLGCVGEKIVAGGERRFDFGKHPLPAWSRLDVMGRYYLVCDIIEWHDDLTDADSDDVREVLRQVMV